VSASRLVRNVSYHNKNDVCGSSWKEVLSFSKKRWARSSASTAPAASTDIVTAALAATHAGPWRVADTPHVREPLDAMDDPRTLPADVFPIIGDRRFDDGVASDIRPHPTADLVMKPETARHIKQRSYLERKLGLFFNFVSERVGFVLSCGEPARRARA
jgi:hypothetical protein